MEEVARQPEDQPRGCMPWPRRVPGTGKLAPTTFLRRWPRSRSPPMRGAHPVVPNAMAGAPLTVFSARPHRDVPAHPLTCNSRTQSGPPSRHRHQQDVWMLVIGLSLLADHADDNATTALSVSAEPLMTDIEGRGLVRHRLVLCGQAPFEEVRVRDHERDGVRTVPGRVSLLRAAPDTPVDFQAARWRFFLAATRASGGTGPPDARPDDRGGRVEAHRPDFERAGAAHQHPQGAPGAPSCQGTSAGSPR